jgi:hypothetical protein
MFRSLMVPLDRLSFADMSTTFVVLVLTALPPTDRWPKGFRGDAPARRVDGVDIVDKGIYKADVLQIIPDRNSATGTRERIGNITLQQDTATIPSVKHARFGFRYSITGAPQGGPVALKIVVIYPQGGQRSRGTGTTRYCDEFTLTQPIGGGPYYWGFRVEDDTALGVWKFQVWIDQRMLAEQAFNVVRP